MKDACLKTDIHIQQQLQLQQNGSVLELVTFHSYPNFKIKTISVIIIWLTAMVLSSILQDVLCSNSNLMSTSCVQEDTVVPGVVI
jgi:hypothetical protein